MNFEKEVASTKRSLKLKISSKMAKPVKLDDGLYPADVLVESVNWQAAILQTISWNVFKSIIWSKLNKTVKSTKEAASFRRMRAIFFTLVEFSHFFYSCFGKKYLTLSERVGPDYSTIFVCPYGIVKSSFKLENFGSYQTLYKAKGWKELFVDTTVNTGNLKCTYKNLHPQLVFIVEELAAVVNGKKGVFFFVVLPDDNGSNVQLMPGVVIRGRKGVLPASSVAQRNSRLPMITYISRPGQLGPVYFHFRTFQLINGNLTWKVKPLSVQIEEAKDDDEVVVFQMPRGFQRSAPNISVDFLENGSLVNLNVLFKLYDAEWRHMKVVSLIPAGERSDARPYSYNVRLMGPGGGLLPVLFQLEKYDPNAMGDEALATWFLIIPSQT